MAQHFLGTTGVVLKHLVKRGADPNVKHNDAMFALNYAAQYCQTNIIEYLVEHGANIEAKSGNPYQTPLVYAVRYNIRKESVIRLINLGADLSSVWSPSEAIRDDSCQQPHEKEKKNLLLTYFANTKAIANEGDLHKAVRTRFNTVIVPIIAYHKPPSTLASLLNARDRHGQTALDIAFATRNTEALLILLSHGADPLAGIYDGLELASRIPEWRTGLSSSTDADDKSIYSQIYLGVERHYEDFLMPMPELAMLPNDVVIILAQFMAGAHALKIKRAPEKPKSSKARD